jgi:hypothetical protein
LFAADTAEAQFAGRLDAYGLANLNRLNAFAQVFHIAIYARPGLGCALDSRCFLRSGALIESVVVCSNLFAGIDVARVTSAPQNSMRARNLCVCQERLFQAAAAAETMLCELHPSRVAVLWRQLSCEINDVAACELQSVLLPLLVVPPPARG